MKSLLLLFFSVSLLQNSRAISVSCFDFLNTNELISSWNLTKNFEAKKNYDLDTFFSNPTKTWIKTASGHYRSYSFVKGKAKKPIYIALLGLGDSIEQSLAEQKTIQENIDRGHHVLILEGAKQGDTAILGLKLGTRENFETNMLGFEDLLDYFFKTEEFNFTDIVLAGHSYGAYAASHLAHIIQTDTDTLARSSKKEPRLTLQLYAPAVTNFNNRFNPGWLNRAFNRMSNYLDLMGSNYGYEYQVSEVKKAIAETLPHLLKDPLKLRMAAELTVDAGSMHILDNLKKINQRVMIQIFLAENENFIFPMMHLETFDALTRLNVQVQLIEIRGVSHYLPQELTPEQLESWYQLTTSPPLDLSYLRINKDGSLVQGRYDDYVVRSKTASLNLWNKSMERISKSSKPDDYYSISFPSEWK